MKKNTSGFTLIEVIVVIAVLAVLVAMTLFAYGGAQARSRDAKRKTDIANITKALELYYQDNGSYPIPSGTSSVINTNWYSSGDASWTTFSTTLTAAKAIDALPVDPINNSSSPLTTAGRGYAYYAGARCGKVAGQWFLLTYRYEVVAKEKFTDGTCDVNEIGDVYYNASTAVSYYRSTK
jgi:prepilin-type N-terminal cleavage/methylation domain-containing protein